MKIKTAILFMSCLYLLRYAVHGFEFNIALNQNVTTSSVVANHPVSMATDQKLSTYVQVDFVAGVPAWILFDLKFYTFHITKIIIWPTNDTDFELAKVSVYVQTSIKKLDYSADYICTYDRPVRGVPFNCTGQKNSLFRIRGYVRLTKESYFSDESLKIAEIAIITDDEGYEVKYWKSVQQSNGIIGAGLNGPENAIDSDWSTCIYTDQKDASKQNIRGWWHADLGEHYEVFAFLINDRYTQNQSYRGNYKLYVDIDGFTKSLLCAYDRQVISDDQQFAYCSLSLTGRYITVERELSSGDADRTDMLSFCLLRLAVIIKERIFTNPQDYIYTSISTTSGPASGTTSGTTSVDAHTDIEPMALKEKIIIGVVTGGIAVIVCAIIFGIIFYCVRKSDKKKRIAKQSNKTKKTDNENRIVNVTTENATDNTYSEINESSMNINNGYEICLQ